MGATGSAILDFGAVSHHNTGVQITGQVDIVATSKVEAFVRLQASVHHSVDEHMIEQLKITAGNIAEGVGFTIYGEANPQAYGYWNIDWVWV